MKKYRFLTLTDHARHSAENSLYQLMTTLAKHEQCEQIDVASRGNMHNDAFFKGCLPAQLSAKAVDADFAFDASGAQFMETSKLVDIRDYDVVFMRLPRPISNEFLHFLSRIAAGKIIINNPSGIMKTSSKSWLLNFPELCPSMRLCFSIDEILEFATQFPIVLKPLREYGGKGIVRIEANQVFEGNQAYPISSYLESIRETIESEGYLAMKFLKNVSQGDKRILVVNGQILAASLRLPPKDSWLCNVAQGGRSILAEVEPEEIQIVETISPKLLAAGIVFCGIDTLVNDDGKRVLSEVNTLSVGGFPQAEAQTGRPVLQQAINEIIKHLK